MNKVIREDIENIIAQDINWSQLKGSKVLITGASGMIAGYVIRTLLQLNDERDYDIEIYGPLPRSREGRYAVVLWEAYGTHVIGEIKDVPFSNVGDRVMELVATWCPPEVCKALWGNSDSV